jgi:secreted trypsin-like serine protease
MHRRILFAVLTACLAGAMTLAGASTAAAASGHRLPIQTGPGGAVRAPAPVSPRVVGGTPVSNGQYPFQAALLAQSFGSTDFSGRSAGAA